MFSASPLERRPRPLTPSIKRGPAPRPDLPVPLTPILGRDREIADAGARMDRDDTRLLTLTGPGGIGKTRLALEVASQIQDDFAHGVCFVSLAAIREPHLVPAAIAQALGVRESGERPVADMLLSALHGQHLLLVLDNMEQVVEAAPWLAELLARCPRLKVMVTSRGPLHIRGEQRFPVPPLPVPDGESQQPAETLSQFAAVALFVQRARAMRPGFALSESNAEAVRDICRHLDGLPLAIELAAARVSVFPPEEILPRLADRLTLLTGSMRDAPERHRTMRDAIAWSYDLLTPDEQQLFRRLSVFVGGFTLDAARAVAIAENGEPAPSDGVGHDPTVLDRVASLVDQNLIRQTSSVGDEPRFGMLGTIREFGLEQLEASGELDEISRRHAMHMLALAEWAEPELAGAEQVEWLNRLGAAYRDLRSALTWMQQHGEHEPGLRLITALWRYGYTRGSYSETRRWLDTMLAVNPEPSTVRVEALNGSGILASVQRDRAVAVSRHIEARELGMSLDDHRGVAYALNGLGVVAEEFDGQRAEARQRYTEARDLFQQAGDRRAVAVMMINLGNLHWSDGALDEAIDLQKQAGDLFREVGWPRGVAWSATNLGSIAIEQGDLNTAAEQLREAIELYRDLGDLAGIIEVLERFADIAGARNRHERQVQLLGAAAMMREPINLPVSPIQQDAYDEELDALRRRLGERFSPLWEAGRALSLDEAMALAMASEETTRTQPVTVTPAPIAVADHGLSARELEVLKLMADGLSNQEIADTLFVSHRTVTSHASSVLGKLGLTSRTAAVAYAIRHGLA